MNKITKKCSANKKALKEKNKNATLEVFVA